jgi:hypothetical protein
MHSFAAADFEGDLDEPWPGPPTPLFAGPQGDRYGDMRAPAFRGARQWGLKGGMGLALAAFVVLYGSVVLFHRYDQAAPSSPISSADNASKSVEGAIGANGGAQPPQKLDDSVPPDMSIANLPPPATSSAPRPPVAQAQPAPALNPAATQAPTPTPGPAATQTPTLAPTQTPTPTFTLAPSPPPTVATGAVSPPATADASAQQTPQSAADDARGKSHGRTRAHGKAGDWRSRDADKALAQAAPQPQAQPQPTRASMAARTLDNVQARLAKNDLSGARASLSGVLATDPRNGYALSLREQLASREQARDASLSAARACVVQSRWHCVWHNAGTALSIDASSTEAKALVDRAIIESGAATAPAGPGPDNVEVPMVQ